MAVYRVQRTRDYTVMSNYHLKDKGLTLKSKGLLSMILSLPEEWNYTTRGLASICKEGVDAISIYFNYIGKFENEVTQLAEPTEQEIRQMREEIEEAKKEKSRAYHRNYSREYRARNLEKQREYDRIKAREYRARRKAQTAAAQPAQ